MKRKNIVGLIAIVAIVAVAMFAGCVEKPPSAPTITPTPTSPTGLSLGESAVVDDILFTLLEYEFEDSYRCEYSVANTFMPNRLQKIIRMPIKTDYHDYS